MTDRTKVLGRGISSLISNIPQSKPQFKPSPGTRTSSSEVAHSDEPLKVTLADIRPNPHQPRRRFSEKALEELSQSIGQHGVIQPLLVRRVGSGYELIAGERRLRAAEKAGLTEVPVTLRKGSNDQERLELALIENLQREDLNPVEEAKGLQRLAQEFGLTQEETSRRVGKERSTVTNLLRLLQLPTSVQEMLAVGVLSAGHARALLSLDNPRRQEVMAQKIEKEGLSVRKVEALVRAMSGNGAKKGRRVADRTAGGTNLRHMADELQRALGTRVDVTTKGKAGEIRIHFFSPEELTRLGDRLLRPPR